MTGLVNASSIFQDRSAGDALVEVSCEKDGECDTDIRAYKGVFARSMARAAQAAPNAADTIKKMLSNNAKLAASACTAGTAENDAECNFAWANATSNWDTASATNGNLGEMFNALEVVQGMLYPSAKALKRADGVPSGNVNASGTGIETQSAGTPQHTGAATPVAASVSVIIIGAFAVVSML